MTDNIEPGGGSYDPREFRYFYISYSIGPLGAGCTMLRQKQQVDGQPDNGLNISTAHEILANAFNVACIVMFWQEVTFVRYQQWLNFTKKHSHNCQGPGSSLTVHQGGAQESEKSKASLKIIDKETPDNADP